VFELLLVKIMNDKNHWIWNLFYANKDDERLLVPKKIGVGRTLNFCHPKAQKFSFFTMIVIFVFICCIVCILKFLMCGQIRLYSSGLQCH